MMQQFRRNQGQDVEWVLDETAMLLKMQISLLLLSEMHKSDVQPGQSSKAGIESAAAAAQT